MQQDLTKKRGTLSSSRPLVACKPAAEDRNAAMQRQPDSTTMQEPCKTNARSRAMAPPWPMPAHASKGVKPHAALKLIPPLEKDAERKGETANALPRRPGTHKRTHHQDLEQGHRATSVRACRGAAQSDGVGMPPCNEGDSSSHGAPRGEAAPRGAGEQRPQLRASCEQLRRPPRLRPAGGVQCQRGQAPGAAKRAGGLGRDGGLVPIPWALTSVLRFTQTASPSPPNAVRYLPVRSPSGVTDVRPGLQEPSHARKRRGRPARRRSRCRRSDCARVLAPAPTWLQGHALQHLHVKTIILGVSARRNIFGRR